MTFTVRIKKFSPKPARRGCENFLRGKDGMTKRSAKKILHMIATLPVGLPIFLFLWIAGIATLSFKFTIFIAAVFWQTYALDSWEDDTWNMRATRESDQSVFWEWL